MFSSISSVSCHRSLSSRNLARGCLSHLPGNRPALSSQADCGSFLVCYRSGVEPLSFSGKRWLVHNDLRTQLPASRRDSAEHLAGLLARDRGIERLARTARAERFGPDASLLVDCDRAMDRIAEAANAREKIAIFGDYDCDGVTSTALLARYFRRRGVQPTIRLPHRQREGYGLKPAIIRECIDAGVSLLLTVDTGITAVAEIAEAGAAGIDVIVLDHHRVPEELPDAYALLHPALSPTFPLPHPSAAGIAWSVVRLLEERDGSAEWEDRETDIALGAIGTVGDLVELRGANRTLVHRGLQALASLERGPLALLRLQSGIDGPAITSRDVAFRIAPRLNAAGRMDDPIVALQALLGDEGAVLRLEELNKQRQLLVGGLTNEALARAGSSPFLCLKDERYLPGICGLLAGKLCERFGRPCLVSHAHAGLCMASLRSIPSYNVTEGLARQTGLLLSFGGHAAAAGCTFAEVRFEELRERMEADVAATVRAEDLVPVLTADYCVDAQHLGIELCEMLHGLEPFGQGNPEPSFVLRGVALRGPRGAGKDAAHLQAFVGDAKLIGFHMGRHLPRVSEPVDLLCRVGIDTWQGARSAQLFLDDMRSAVTDGVGRAEMAVQKERAL